MSEFNDEPIDIVVPWVNPNDSVWRKEFEYWKKKETGNKDACRYRDWGFIKFVLRSIEENCPWCRYVFLVLSGPSQIPDWLNIENPKLKIIFHKDYIPEEFLPTFNSNVIELFYSNIKELSENFILINDDMFFCQKKNEDFFFKNNIPVIFKKPQKFYNDRWSKTLINSRNLANKILNKNDSFMFSGIHLPICYKKSLQQFIFTKIDLSFMKNNKFRKENDLTHFLYLDIQGKTGNCIINNTPRGINQPIRQQQSYLFNYPMICINENEFSTDIGCKLAVKSLSLKFNKKSSFEK